MICGHPEVDAGKCHADDRSYTAVNSHMAGGVLELVKQLCRLKQVVSYGDFKPLLMNIDERVKPSELGCGGPTLGCRELWMTAFIQ